MVSLIDDFGDPERSSRARVIGRAAHLFPWVMTVWAVFIAVDYGGLWRPPTWLTVLVLAPVLMLVMLSQAHQGLARVCVECMRRLPADAPIRAARYRRLLWLRHRMAGWQWFWVVGPLIAAEVVIRAVFGIADGDAPWTTLPLAVVVFGNMVGEWLHHRYRPWCPYCRRWDDGGGPREPSPVPDPGGVRSG